MTTELLCKTILPAILPAAEPFTVTATVLEQKNSPLCLTNPGHLPKRAHRLWEGTGGNGRDYGVKALIGKRESRRVRQRKRNVHGQFCSALPRYIQHFSADIHGDNPATGRIIGRFFPVPTATSRTFPDACRKSCRRSFLTPRTSGIPSTRSYQRAKRSYFSDISREVKCTGTL